MLVATNVMEHPLLHHFDASPSFHFGSQNNVAGMLHYISSHQHILVPFLFGKGRSEGRWK